MTITFNDAVQDHKLEDLHKEEEEELISQLLGEEETREENG